MTGESIVVLAATGVAVLWAGVALARRVGKKEQGGAVEGAVGDTEERRPEKPKAEKKLTAAQKYVGGGLSDHEARRQIERTRRQQGMR